jgi:hypothetical protein
LLDTDSSLAYIVAFNGVTLPIVITAVAVIISTNAQMFLHKIRYNLLAANGT